MIPTATFPVELWWYILRLAVHIPGQFETKWDYSPDFLIYDAWDGMEMSDAKYRDSLLTKLSICRVSRCWREIGATFLYEDLRFTEHQIIRLDMSKIVSIFEHHAGHSGYGRSTKRLDVPGEALVQPYFPSLLRLLKFCYDIRVFVLIKQRFLFDPKRQSHLCSVLQNRFGHSLRRMKFHVEQPLHHLPNIPLYSLELSAVTYNIDPSVPLAFTTVSSFCIDFVLYFEDVFSDACSSWRFPSLRHLTFRGISDFWKGSPSLQSFMSIHGPRLHSLQLDNGACGQFSLLPELLAPATALRCLALALFGVIWPSSEIYAPSITHIGVLGPSPPPAEIEWIVLGSFPGLQCIRLLDHSKNDENPCHKDAWMLLLELGRKRNVRIEDNESQLIHL